MSTPSAPLEALARAQSATDQLIAGIRAEQWMAPTPCTEWTVHDVVNHLVTGHLTFVALLGEGSPPDRSADQLGDNPLAAFRAAGQALAAGFTQPGVVDRVYQAPMGPAPGAMLLQVRIGELLVHGWDLAHATGQPAAALLPADLAEQQLAVWQARLGDGPRDGAPIAPAQPVADEAPAIDRLAAYFGRALSAVTLSDRAHFFAAPQHKDDLLWCFTTVLGCGPAMSLDGPGLTEPVVAFRFPRGGSVSVEFTDDAPTEQQARRGAWLEITTDDPAALQDKVLAAGLPQVHYPATTTFYFAAPGGQVFGIVPAGHPLTPQEEMRMP